MAFTTKEWQDGSEGGTALDADALVDMETRLADYADSVGGGGGGGGSRAYIDAVQRVPGLSAYLPLQVNATAEVGANGTLVSGTTIATDVALPPGLGTKAAIFDGANDMLTVPLDLGTASATLFAWARLEASADSDNILFELGSVGIDNGFLVDLVSGGSFYVVVKGTSSYNPTSNVPADHRSQDGQYHAIAVVFDRNYPVSNDAPRVEIYLDGETLLGATGSGDIGTANYAATTLNVMARDGNTLNAAGGLAHVAVFNRRLLSHEITYLSTAHLLAP